MSIYTYMYICLHTHMYMHTRISIFLHTYMYTYVCIHLCIYAFSYICMYMHIYMCVHKCIYVCISVCTRLYSLRTKTHQNSEQNVCMHIIWMFIYLHMSFVCMHACTCKISIMHVWIFTWMYTPPLLVFSPGGCWLFFNFLRTSWKKSFK